MIIAALIPTFYRPQGLTRVLLSLEETAPRVVPVVAVEADDHEGLEIALSFGAQVGICELPKQGCSYAWNTALKAYPSADVYVIGSDDSVFVTGWLEAALVALSSMGGSGLVGFNSHWKNTDLAFHYMMTRDFMIKYHGGVAAVPHYSAWCVDDEACLRAKSAGKWKKALDSYVEHEWKKNGMDEGYILGKQRRNDNKKIFYERKARKFPDDFPPIIK